MRYASAKGIVSQTVSDEPEPEPVAQERRRVAERDADLRRVHDVGAAEVLLEAEVAVAGGERREVAAAPARQQVAHGPHALDRELERREVERVRARREHAHVEPVAQELPRPQVPRVRGVAAEQDDVRPRHRVRSA